MEYRAGEYDVIVIGAGHAGCEAALAAARMNCKTLLVTLSIDNIALMPCNPSIGGPAKAQLVREIDALGGEMALNIDRSCIQMRMLNTGKGPAVRALRAQADKKEYQKEMVRVLLNQPNLDVVQAEVERIQTTCGRVSGVITRTGAEFSSRSLVITTGTYMKGRIIIGDLAYEGGPNGQFPARMISDSLKELGLTLGRFKTGTPPRINARSMDYSKLIEQPGDVNILNFSFMSPRVLKSQISCWLTHSNKTTHQIVKDNLHRSPLYSGVIKGIGPRHCPSFEDKVVRFAEKDAHQIFLEPEGRYTDEVYVQGLNTSLPEDVQILVLKSLPGLENVKIIRTGYAIEYDYIIPTQLKLNLECRDIKGLFTAGQINGTSGYEEAAAQGLMAGINAALYVQDRDPLILKRSEAFIGVLVDDLVTKGIDEPYRLMTSLAEYRLMLRQDNADQRLTPVGYEIGLASEDRIQQLEKKKTSIRMVSDQLKEKSINSNDDEINELLSRRNSTTLKEKTNAWQILRRPEVKGQDFTWLMEPGIEYEEDIWEQVEIDCKYEGYIRKQLEQIKKFDVMENKKLAQELNYDLVEGISNEARYKLKKVRPNSIGQASRITGVSPADISVLLIHLEKMKRPG
ncbi:MAG: tRNA uridine-5-carboxymethylaminomethyl(34) synthesis enzyme MnmG [Chitinophagales bacterium]